MASTINEKRSAKQPVPGAPATRGRARRAGIGAVILLTGIWAANAGWTQGAPMGKGARGPAQVGVIEMQPQSVPLKQTLPGRAVAYEQAAIRPRVSGMVSEILYTPGQPLPKGTPMFRLDADSYEATVAADQAALAQAEAALPAAEAALARAEQLRGSGITAADVESAQVTLAQAQASVQSAQAALKLAQTQLSWTTITSPIDGVADVAAVSVGDLVTAAQTDALTTVTRLDPIYVDMIEPSAHILAVRDQIESGALTRSAELEATLVLENGETLKSAGKLIAPGFTVSTTTGTVGLRFQFDNPDLRILPGTFVRGEVVLGTIDAYLVPQRATTRARDGSLTAWFAGADNKAAKHTLITSGTNSNAWIVTEGVSAGDRLIVDGISSLTEGAEVAPVAVTINALGVVVDTPATDAAPDGAATPGAAAPAASE
ncbi:efflux RND transporter periplasmic adaptor subunit [Phaeovulum sp. W22_SRMD_FR3]